MKTELGEVRNLIFSAVREMNLVRSRDYSGIWRDVQNDTGIIIECEAICSLLLAHRCLEDRGVGILGDSLVITDGEVFGMIRNLLQQCEEKGLIGYPYLQIRNACPAFSREPDYVDTASFLLTTLHLFWQVYRDRLLNEQHREVEQSLRRNLLQALQVIDEAYIDGEIKGWSWGREDKPDEPFLYFTWTIVETISDIEENKHILRDFPEAEDLANRLFARLDAVRTSFEHRYLGGHSSTEEQVNYDVRKGRVVYPQQDSEPHYNIWILLTLLQTGCKREQDLKAGIDVLKRMDDEDKHNRFIQRLADVPLDGRSLLKPDQGVRLQDRCYLPQLLKAVAIFVDMYPAYVDEYGAFLDDLYDKLKRNIRRDKYLFVWDAAGEYAIYYSERSIEALCALYRLLSKLETANGRGSESRPAETEADGIVSVLAEAVDKQLGVKQLMYRVMKLEERLKQLTSEGSKQGVPDAIEGRIKAIEDKQKQHNQRVLDDYTKALNDIKELNKITAPLRSKQTESRAQVIAQERSNQQG